MGVVAARVHLPAGLGEEGLGVLEHLLEDGQRVQGKNLKQSRP